MFTPQPSQMLRPPARADPVLRRHTRDIFEMDTDVIGQKARTFVPISHKVRPERMWGMLRGCFVANRTLPQPHTHTHDSTPHAIIQLLRTFTCATP